MTSHAEPDAAVPALAAIAIQLFLLVGSGLLLMRGPRVLRWLRLVLVGQAWLLLDRLVTPFAVVDEGLLADVPIVAAFAVSALLVAFFAADHEVRTRRGVTRTAVVLVASLTLLFLVVPAPVGLAVALVLWVGGTAHLGWQFRKSAGEHPGSLLEARLRLLSAALWLLSSVSLASLGGPFVLVWLLPMVLGTTILALAVAPPPFLQLVVRDTRAVLRQAERVLASVGVDDEAGPAKALAGVAGVFGADAVLLEDGGVVLASVGDPGSIEVGRAVVADGADLTRSGQVVAADDGRWVLIGDTGRGRLVVVLSPVGVLLSRSDREHVEAMAERIGLALDRGDARRADRRATASMMAAQRMRDDLLSTLSHELRTPLTSIMGFGEVLRDHADQLSGEQRTDMLDRIVAKGAHLERIVTGLLDLTAVRGRSEPDRIALYDLRSLAERAVARGVHRSQDREVTVEGDVGVVHSDGGAVMAVLEQLLDNAAKFSPPDTPITMELSGDDAAVAVVVRDEGHGLESLAGAELFEPFVRGGDVLTRTTGGVGVGLTIARELSRQLGGDLTVVHSEVGAAFRLAMPRRHALAGRHVAADPVGADLAEGDPTLESTTASSGRQIRAIG